MKVIGDSILINFHRVDLLDTFQMFPTCCPVFPFNSQVPTLGCIPDLFVTYMFDINIRVFHSMTISIVISNAFHQVELVSIFITLRVHVLHYAVCSILITAPIRELNLVGPHIQHGIGVGLPLHSATKLTIAHRNLPTLDLITNWYLTLLSGT
jgi:hypothetical protein